MCRCNKPRNVIGDCAWQKHGIDQREKLLKFDRIDHGFQCRRYPMDARHKDFFKNGSFDSGNFDLECEPVELSFRQRVCTFELDGILSGQNKEWIGKRSSLTKC